MMKLIANGMSANKALVLATGNYGQFTYGVSFINPREE
jgi:hypothetical protein